MVLSLYSVRRCHNFLGELEHLLSSDFAYESSRSVLKDISKQFEKQLSSLEFVDGQTDQNVVDSLHAGTVHALFIYTPLLGFLLRSTNVRNCFESYGPLLRLSKSILGDDTHLILSSEWAYSPYNYIYPTFGDCVFIGFPATESNNSLILPIAGHELGHSVWHRRQGASVFKDQVVDIIQQRMLSEWEKYRYLFNEGERDKVGSDLFVDEAWEAARIWALRQIEEIFCDFLGIRLFGEAYMHAFAYLFAPLPRESRSPYYPRIKSRIKYFKLAADRYKIEMPNGYEALFLSDKDDLVSQTESLNLDLADHASDRMVDVLLNAADAVVVKSGVRTSSPAKIEYLRKRYSAFPVPPDDPGTIFDVLTAGWRAFHDEKLWKKHHYHKDRFSILSDLVIKSIEVIEFRKIVESR